MTDIPQQLVYEQTKLELNNLIDSAKNNFKLPAYQIVSILKEMLYSQEEIAKIEYQKAATEYQQSLETNKEQK